MTTEEMEKFLESKTLYKFTFEFYEDNIYVGKSKFDTTEFIIAVQIDEDFYYIFDALNVMQDYFIDEKYYLSELVEKEFNVVVNDNNLLTMCGKEESFYTACQNVVNAMKYVKKHRFLYPDNLNSDQKRFFVMENATKGIFKFAKQDDGLYTITLKDSKKSDKYTIYFSREDSANFHGYSLIGAGAFSEKLNALAPEELESTLANVTENYEVVYKQNAMAMLTSLTDLKKNYDSMIEVMEYLSK